MIDKVWYVIIFMYIASFSFLGVQYVVADVFHHTIVSMVTVTDPITGATTEAGTPMKPIFVDVLGHSNINSVALRVANGDYHPSDNSPFDKVLQSVTAAAFIAWDGVLLISGTYVFNIIVLFGVPYIFVAGFQVVYTFLLIRGIIAIIRGV